MKTLIVGDVHNEFGRLNTLISSKKPDLVILSHVLENFTNVDKEITTLKNNLKIGSLIYVELPGIDS